jgi:RNA polymerase sigma-70 factor (family 1)
MTKFKSFNEKELLDELKAGCHDAFSYLFNIYYKDLVLFAGRFISSKDYCEDIVQFTFLKIWKERESIKISSSLKGYLLQSVKNKCIDEIRHNSVIFQHQSYVEVNGVLDSLDTENYILYSDLSKQLNVALASMPEVCRTPFTLNRFGNMNYKQIAKELNVSERTIEVRIGKALRLLRVSLKEFLILILTTVFYNNM